MSVVVSHDELSSWPRS